MFDRIITKSSLPIVVNYDSSITKYYGGGLGGAEGWLFPDSQCCAAGYGDGSGGPYLRNYSTGKGDGGLLNISGLGIGCALEISDGYGNGKILKEINY